MSTYNAGQSETKNDFGPTTKIAAKEGPIVNEDLLEKEDKGDQSETESTVETEEQRQVRREQETKR